MIICVNYDVNDFVVKWESSCLYLKTAVKDFLVYKNSTNVTCTCNFDLTHETHPYTVGLEDHVHFTLTRELTPTDQTLQRDLFLFNSCQYRCDSPGPQYPSHLLHQVHPGAPCWDTRNSRKIHNSCKNSSNLSKLTNVACLSDYPHLGFSIRCHMEAVTGILSTIYFIYLSMHITSNTSVSQTDPICFVSNSTCWSLVIIWRYFLSNVVRKM